LTRGPLLRAWVARLAPASHLLLLDMHHIASDGWSMGLLVSEVNALYRAFSQGEPSPLPPLAIQYPDFARWQRAWLRGAALDEQLASWRGRFADRGRPLDLPTDRPRPPVRRFRGGHRTHLLAPELVSAADRLAGAAGASRFMLLLAVLAAFLERLSGA